MDLAAEEEHGLKAGQMTRFPDAMVKAERTAR
jgi:hypothetical protein